jgi:cyclopropane fatty-acyl-phospholipid synthase-like methyltransferase
MPPSPPNPLARDRHALYEAAVQGVEYDLDFFERVWRTTRGGRFRTLREDFSGTAQLACAWAARRPGNRASALDLDPEVLAWARQRRLPRLGPAARRVRLLRRDVRSVTRPAVQVVAALNYSFWTFRTRDDLRRYFRAARRSLSRRGLLFLAMYGGTGAMDRLQERRRVAPWPDPDGLLLPVFTYVWEQAEFNPVDHHLRCHIHFRLPGGRTLRRAFTYDWRMWTLPEVREALDEAGFRASEVYVEGWDDRHQRPDDTYRRRRRFENQTTWLGYVVWIV